MSGLLARLRNVRIARKLSIGFGVVLLLVAVATVLSVARFKEIRDIYQKTNLIYNINIEVFQAKINRLKYFYGDDKAGDTMARYVSHASALTSEANALTWSEREAAILNDLSGHLQAFQTGISGMQAATGKLAAIRASLDELAAQDQTARYTALIRTPLADSTLSYEVYDLLFAISNVRDYAYALRYSVSETAQQALEQHYRTTESAWTALNSQLPPELQTPMQALWQDTGKVRTLSNDYYSAFLGLKAAEDGVKVAGDKSSASLKEIIGLVKAYNDELAYGSANITLIIGAIAILIGILVSVYITRQITRPVLHNLALAERIASGDLSSRIEVDRDDELGKLTAAMSRMNDRLRGMIGDVRTSVSSVSRAATTIATGNSDLSSRTEQQAAAVVQTAASMEQLTATVKNNADNARHASKISAEASSTAAQGGVVVRDVVKTMGDISASSKKIADITAVINSIAFQTNILALNAAVEAARAGEQGRGFAVVASEVRSLSQRSSQAAKDIEQLISESVSRIQTGSDLVARAGETMDQVVSSVTRVNDIMDEISSASEEQSRGIEQIARAVGELDTTTQQNASLVMASSSSATSLEEQASLLERLVSNFRLEHGARTASAPPVERSAPPAARRQAVDEESWTTF